MKLEAGKELDRRCVWDWLNEVYVTPSRAFSEYTDEEIRTFAHDALVLLEKPEPKQVVHKQGKRENSDGSIDYFAEWYFPHCGKLLNRGFDMPWIEFCYKCGKPVLWEGR